MNVLHDNKFRGGLVVVAAVSAVAVIGPFLTPYDPESSVDSSYLPPTAGHPLGTDYLGSDVLSRVLAGGWSLAWMVVTASVLALVLGTIVGVCAAAARGLTERTVLWACDVLLAFPHIVLVLVVVAMLGRSPVLMTATVATAFLAGVIRLARSVTAEVLTHEFVVAARLSGVPTRRLLLHEVLPNIVTPLLVHLGTMVTWAVGIFSALAFLGYGVSAPQADWGLMINENRAGLQLQPWGVLAPVLLVIAFAVGANLMADGVGAAQSRTSTVTA